MFPHRNSNIAPVEPETYPLGEKHDASGAGFALALVSLSHTPAEQRIYSAMLSSPDGEEESSFTARRLISLTGIRSLTTIRRGLDGLLVKLSIERAPKENGNGKRDQGNTYRVFSPDEILNRRKQLNAAAGHYGNLGEQQLGNHSFERAIARVADNPMLSRREAQVALCCVEGLTNAEIGKRLEVTEQTVKFHLRHVFIKFGVKRRAELISKLLM